MTVTGSAIRTYIVDEDAEERACMRQILVGWGLDILGESGDPAEALASISSGRPDVAVMDVDLPGCSAFDLLDELEGKHLPEIVLVSGSHDAAAKAFDYNAVDYIVKPCEKKRFEAAVAKVFDRFRGRNGKDIPVFMDRIVVRSRDRIYFVKLDDVAWIEAAADYVHIHAGGKRHTVRAKIGELERRLDPRSFVRIHRSAIVHLDRICELRPLYHGEYQIVLKDNTELTLSRGYRNRFSQYLVNPIS